MQSFSERLLVWFKQHGRKDLPWQYDRTAYRVWLSEIMLQQTQVSTVIPYFQKFTETYPTVGALAAASEDEVMRLWAGLGYYARARNLHRCAQQVANEYAGEFPDSQEKLEALPGIGRSTAGAILAQAFKKRGVILDGNVKRVLARHKKVSGWPGTQRVQKTMWAIADAYTPDRNLTDYTQAIMDLGATVCRRSQPDCSSCPVNEDCRAFQDDNVADYPEKKPRRALPRKSQVYLICRHQSSVLLEKRPPSGIWGGLWALPELATQDDIPVSVRQRYGMDIRSIQPLESVQHRFTHFELELKPYVVEVEFPGSAVHDDAAHWVKPDKIYEYGLPSPIKVVLESLLNEVSNS